MTTEPKRIVAVCGVALFIAFAIWLRIGTKADIFNMDEIIPLEVSKGMAARGDLDTNWALASTLPDFFRYPSYNFAAYNLLVHPFAASAEKPLEAVRLVNVLFQLGAAVALFFAAARPGWPSVARWLAPALFLLAPGVVQDAHMARPESLTYLLTALALLVVCRIQWPLLAAGVLGVVLGAGIAVKISFATLGLLALPIVFATLDVRNILIRCAVIAGAVLASFAMCAPYAILNPGALFNGVAELMKQYSAVHAPFSMVDHHAGVFAWWVFSFFALTLGGVFAVGLASPLLLHVEKQERLIVAMIWLSSAGLFAYFATKTVFFERNLAHAIPQLCILAALAIGRLNGVRLQLAAALLVAAIPVFWSMQIASASRYRTDFAAYETPRDIVAPATAYFYTPIEEAVSCKGTLVLHDYTDERSEQFAARLKARGLTEISVRESRFAALPMSTLQIYVEPTFRYFRCPEPR